MPINLTQTAVEVAVKTGNIEIILVVTAIVAIVNLVLHFLKKK